MRGQGECAPRHAALHRSLHACLLLGQRSCLPLPKTSTDLTIPPPLSVQVSPAGEVLQVLMDPDGSRVSHVSSVTEHEGKLYLGNLGKDYVSVLDLGAAATAAAVAAPTAGTGHQAASKE